jgi:two-component system CheB/CheR fusion protein
MVNEDGDIIYITGRTGIPLEPVAGKANWNIQLARKACVCTKVLFES